MWGTGGMTLTVENRIGRNLSQRHSVHHICGYSPASVYVLVLLLTWLVLKTNGSCTLILTSDTVALWQGRGVEVMGNFTS